MMDRPRKAVRKILGVESLEQKVRPKLRPVGVLAVAISVGAAVSYGVGAIASAIFGQRAFHSSQMFSSGAGKAISLVIILILARDGFGLRRLIPGQARWWSVPVGVILGTGLFTLEWMYDPSAVPLADLLSRVPTQDQNLALLAVLSAFTFAVSGGAEELLFRGLIQTSAERYYRPISAIVLTSLLFAGPHLSFGWVAFTELFVVGMVFSWYRRAAGSLILPIIVHAVHNLLYGIVIILTY